MRLDPGFIDISHTMVITQAKWRRDRAEGWCAVDKKF